MKRPVADRREPASAQRLPARTYMTSDLDVIVVGAGGSGLAAAVSAAEHGLSVTVFESRPAPGGTTALAVGSFTAARTDHQQRTAIVDDVAEHAEDAGRFAPPEIESRNNDPLRRYFLSHASDTLRWLEGMGLLFHGPSPEPPNRVPRMHNVIPSGHAYVDALRTRLLALGGMLRCGTAVTRLLVENERVCGVVIGNDAGAREFRAQRGVVIASGDYAAAPDIIARYKGESFADIEGINPHATGAGHRLLEAAGAQLVNMEVTYGPELRFVAPPRGFSIWQHPENALFADGAALVNRIGERFCDGTKSPDREIALAGQPEKTGYILLDERLIARYSTWPHFISTAPEIAYAYVADYLRLRPDITVTAGSLEEVARRRGMRESALRESAWQCGLEGRQWILLGPAKAYFTTTEGGAAVTERLEVLNREGRVIPGLYAVGQAGLGGMILWGHGLHIAWAMTSGRLAGKVLADNGVLIQH